MAAPDFVTSTLYSDTTEPLRVVRPRTSRETPRSAMPVLEAIADFLVCAGGLLATMALCTLLQAEIAVHSTSSLFGLSAAFAVVTVFLMHRDGTYRSSGSLLQIRATERALRATLQALLLLWVVGWLLGQPLAWQELVLAAVFVPVLLFLAKLAFFRVERRARHKNRVERVVIYGTGEAGRRALSTLLQSPRLKLEPVALIDDSYTRADDEILEMGYRGRGSVPLHHCALTPSLLRSVQCDLLMVARSDLAVDRIETALDAANQLDLEVAFVDGPYAGEQLTESLDLDGLALTTTRQHRRSWFYPRAKRVLDVVASSVLLCLLAPLLFLIAILIRLDSPGPALFIQKRVGRNGAFFDIYKFRSMHVGAAKYASSPTSSSDPRITRAGRILRRLSLDELPQLINVLIGTMTLVGPRPEMPFIVERYDSRQRQRLGVTPGITGLWQLSADRSFPIHRNIEYDLYYIRHRNLSMDLAILVHTLAFAMCGGI